MKSTLVVVEFQDYRRVAVVGDLHGDYQSLEALLKIVDFNSDLLVFLGDYADRGPDGVEVIRTVASLQREHPKNVIALMGNHEDFSEDGNPNFNPCTLIDEAQTKTDNWNRYFRDELKPFLDTLPLCALIPNNALLVHAGISSKLTSIDDLKSPSEELRMDLLWSDPFDGEGEHPNYMRGAGVEWGEDVSAVVCKALGVGRVIRSHQPQLAATKPALMHGGRVVTVNATTVYGGHPFVYFIDPNSTKKDYYKSI